MRFNLSVITATWKRPRLLWLCLAQLGRQELGWLQVERVVVSDGPDPVARRIAEQFGAVYYERETHGGRWGAYAKDDGVVAARGDYVCFCDDDNHYEPSALWALYCAAAGADIGIVQARHLAEDGSTRVIPDRWNGRFHLGCIDSMCVCVRRELAQQQRWSDTAEYENDYYWLTRLAGDAITMRFEPTVIGTHL